MNKPIINGLLISAGLSGRMGQFKPLMNYDGKSFVVGITRKMLKVCDRVVIVTGFRNEDVRSLINSEFSTLNSQFSIRVECVFNPNYEHGMFTSLQTGLTELKDSEWILYHFVDQPFYEEKFYRELISQRDDNYDWIQPCYNAKEGHPVLFKKNIFKKIITADPSSSLRLIRDDGETKIKIWECGYSQILNDFDTLDDMKNFLPKSN